MRIVATTGMPGAGKGLAIDVANELGVPVVSMGDLVREEAKRRGLPDAPESFGKVASEVRKKEGPAAWAQRTLKKLDSIQEDLVLVDGVRNLDEVDVFRERFGPSGFCLVAVLAAPATRYARMRGRRRGEDALEEKVQRDRDARELGYGLGAAIAMADIYVDNEGHADEARQTLKAILGAAH